MIKFSVKGDWKNTFSFLNNMEKLDAESVLKKYAEVGVRALSSATPVRTGRTADSWSYEINKTSEGYVLTWINTNVNQGRNIALLIQYGHGTGTGGYISGYDYINPALKPVFNDIADELFSEVSKV